MQRVVSLLPSATEIVAALGCADRLVARSHECDFPADVERLPALTAWERADCELCALAACSARDASATCAGCAACEVAS